jgi:hypothetical protein
MSSIQDIEPMIKVQGIRHDNTPVELNPTEITDISSLSSFRTINFFYVSPIPSNVQNKFVSRNGLNTPRAFANVSIEFMNKENIESLINPESYLHTDSYGSLFTPYLDDSTFVNGISQKVVMLSQWRKIFSDASLEENTTTGTYSLNRGSFTNTARSITRFTRPKLFNTNWAKSFGIRLLNNSATRNAGKKTAKELYYLNDKAAKLVWFYVEQKLRAIGIDCIVLDADNLSLAVIFYGPNGYYPILKAPGYNTSNLTNAEGRIIITGEKSERIMLDKMGMLAIMHMPELSNSERISLKTCENTPGPRMFKFINPSVTTPSYDWTEITRECFPNRTRGGKRKTPVNRKKRTTRKQRQ